MSAPQLGWSGLGNMGRGMAKNLIQKGTLTHPLLLHNRTTSRAETLSKELGHSTVVETLPELVSKSDITFLCLGDDDSVLSAIDTIIQALTPDQLADKLIVDASTIHPDTTSQIDDKIRKAGGNFVAMPVFGAPAMAESGQLVCVLAGPLQQVQKVLPFTKDVISRANIDYSDQPPSRATHLKIIGNTFILGMVSALSEGHTLAEKSGLGTKQLHQFIETMFPGPYTAYSNRLLSGDYFKRDSPLFGVDLARKDARHAQKLAKDSGMVMKGVQTADAWLEGVQKEMGSQGDIAGIYGAKRAESGLKFKND